MVYLDHNATTPVDERVREAMLPFLGQSFGNPSSIHRYGRQARAALDQAREQVAALVGVEPSQVIFTSGGTESNNFALKGLAATWPAGRMAISAVEHPSVLEPAYALRRLGWQLDQIAVDPQGRVSAQGLAECLGPQTRWVSVMMANNETGVVQDIPAVSAVVRQQGAVLHTDAVQALGKMAVDFTASGAHLMSISAHKIYGPKGVGALIVDKAIDLEPLIQGGGQERDRRSGTENLPGIVGFGVAAALAQQELEDRRRHSLMLRQRLEQGLAALASVTIIAAQAERLPNTVMVAVAGIDGETLVLGLDRAGFAVSSGSACSAAGGEPSHVLIAMGLEQSVARSVIRISIGKDNTEADIAALVSALSAQYEHFSQLPGRVTA